MQVYTTFADKVSAALAETHALQFQFDLPSDDPPFNAGGFVPKPKKPSPMPTHVGPRSTRQYDRRGRRKS